MRKVVACLTLCLLAPEAAQAHRAGASGAYEQAFVEDSPRKARRKQRKRPLAKAASLQPATQQDRQAPAQPPAITPAASPSAATAATAATPASTGQAQNKAQAQDKASDTAPPTITSSIKTDSELPKPAAIDPSLPTGYSQVILPVLLDAVDNFGIQKAANTQQVADAKPKPLPFDIFGIFAFIISVFNPGPSWSELEQSGLDAFAEADYATAVEWFEKAAKKDGSKIDSKHMLGLSLARQGQYDKAIAAYDSALSIKPDDQNTLLDRAYANYQAGKFTQAASDYSKLARLDESNYDYRVGQVLSYYGADDRTNLNTTLSALRSKFTSDVRALNLSGAISQRLKAPAEALEYYRSAQKQDAKSVDAITGIARAYYSLGNNKAAKDAVDKSGLYSLFNSDERANIIYLTYLDGDNVSAMSSYVTLEKESPGAKLAPGNLAVCRLKAMTDATNKLQSGSKDALTYATLATGYYSLADFDSAVYCAQKALALNPNNSKVLCIYGECLDLSGDKKNAELYLSKAIQLDPKFSLAYIDRSNVRLHAGRYQEALDDIVASNKLQPNSATSYTNLALVNNYLERYDESEAALDKALSINPNAEKAYALKADIRQAQGKYDEAVTLYKKAIALAPQDYLYQHYLSDFYWQIGKLDLAEQYRKQVAEIAPNKFEAVVAPASFYLWKRNYDLAGPAYDKALLLKPKDLKANLRRANIYLRTGQKEEAARYFAIVRSLSKTPVQINLDIADTYKNAGYMQDALQIINQAIATAPKDAWSYAKRADLFTLNGDLEAAIKDYDMAIALAPKERYYYTQKADLLADSNRDKEAEALYTANIEKFATASDYSNRGYFYFSRRDFDKALNDFEGALKLDPKTTYAINQKARVLCLTGKTKEGLEFYIANTPAPTAKSTKTQIGDYYGTLADIYRYQPDLDKALENMQYACDKGAGRKHDLSYSFKAYIYIYLGKWQAALEELDKQMAVQNWSMEDPGFGMGTLRWLCYTKLGDNKSASAALDNTLQKMDAGWPKPILEYLSGKISEDDLLKLAYSIRFKTEARCWIAVKNMLQSKNDKARENFQWVTTKGSPDFMEQLIASSFLTQLNK